MPQPITLREKQQTTEPGNSLPKQVALIVCTLLRPGFHGTRKHTYDAAPMSQLPRIYRMKQMLANGRVMTRKRYMDEFETTVSTFKRDLALLRNETDAPIVWDRKAAGYRLETAQPGGESKSELPGMWFSERQLLSLISVEQLLQQIEPRLFKEALAPLRQKLDSLLATATAHKKSKSDFAQPLTRVKVLPMHRRAVDDAKFAAVAAALLTRHQLQTVSIHRQTKQPTTRELSPQRLVSYRDNWYLDAWCHLRKALRTFSLDTLQTVRVLDDAAEDISAADLDQHFASSYGIFAGMASQLAVLRFSPKVTGWIEREQWHPEQTSKALADGSIELTVPYGNATELIRDILRWGADVEVMAPEVLREQVKAQVLAMTNIYL